MVKRGWMVMAGGLVIVLVFAISNLDATMANAMLPSAPSSSNPQDLHLPTEPHPITLAEAWEIMDAYAKKWQPEATIAILQSADYPGDSALSGQDGRRRAWLATLLGTNPPGDRLIVRLIDGSIVDKAEQPPLDITPIASKPAIDSPKALAIAETAKPGFTFADDKGQGFHFVVEESQEGSLILMVRGAFHGWPAIVSLDAATGGVISSRSLAFAQSGGILYSPDAGETWRASNLEGKMITALYANPLAVDWAYAVAVENGVITIYQTRDGGQTWAALGNLPDAAGDWPFSLGAVIRSRHATSLLVGTASGLWTSDDGKTWSQVIGLPEGPKQWLGIIQSDTAYRLFVSITAGKDRGLYVSSDLSHWTGISSSVYRLSESFDRHMVLATDEEQPNQALAFNISDQKLLSVPRSVLHAAGAFDDSAPMLLHSSAGSGRLSHQIEKLTLSAAVASLAAAPDFPNSQVAIMGGFRTGMYRTTDGGETWQQVLRDPSQLIPGNGEIFAVKFLSSTSVIAINGGQLTWKGF